MLLFDIIYEYDSNLVDALIEIFQVTRSIRLLNLHSSLEVIPEEIKYLQHLRYLRFSTALVKLLPRSLSTLYHLQFLFMKMIGANILMVIFPMDMNKLSILRLLSSHWLNFPGIQKLKFLQELNKFDIKNENGYRIEELEHMNELRYVELCSLKYVRDAEEACKAKLCDKRKLTHLSLNWGLEKREIADHDLDERVLDNLQPHNYLKTAAYTRLHGCQVCHMDERGSYYQQS